MVFFERGKNGPPKSPAMADGASVLYAIEEHIPSKTSLRASQRKAPNWGYPPSKQRVVKGTF